MLNTFKRLFRTLQFVNTFNGRRGSSPLSFVHGNTIITLSKNIYRKKTQTD